ncbi:MAG TPA: TRZ/ATZ family hydrolase [Actinobacteria bacterium]|jgi:5-methylthioadenosine/S-adenosylhomocysteine deaminase|nr:TRZ/ATZ family hydrolase [Actinomycetota bacterium]
MEAVDTLITAQWVVPVDDLGTHHRDHAVAIRDGLIVDIGPAFRLTSRYRPRELVDLPHHVVIPGLVNTHTHAAMTLMRGFADDLPLSVWLQDHIWPTEGEWVGPEFVWDGTALAIAEMLTAGVTCFNDMYFFPEVASQASLQFGIRMVAGMICFDMANSYAANANECIDKGLVMRADLAGQSLVTTAFAPHAPYTVSDEPLIRIAELSEQLDARIHMHVCETSGEDAASIGTYGLATLQRLEGLGLLNERLVAAHMVHLSDDDIEAVARAGSSIVHCPESNLKLASGFCRVDDLLRAGVNVALGTDGAASNNDLDLLAEVRVAALLSKAVSNDAASLPAPQALYLATMGGARALGLDAEIGSLEVGKRADVVAVSLDEWSSQPLYNPISQLVYTTTRSQVTDVWVDGNRRVRTGELVDVDRTSLVAKASRWAENIGSARPNP